MSYRKVTGRDWWRVGGYLLLAGVVVIASAVILVPLAWPIGLVVWLSVFATGSLFLLVRWHARHTAYRCPACGHEFEISLLTDLASLQIPDKKYLKCPRCGRRKWATVLMKEKEAGR
jgi:DNA-directed RNA polymerase subunit RPC12/RpoP